ncbi:MAG: aspartate kinase [Cytophagales bacterium]|nr:aspartate kinase [Armatimonadota bacterium]
MRILVQKFGGTSVDSDEHRQMAAARVIRAVQDGWSVVVVVSAIGRQGAPYATDTLVGTLKNVDPAVPPAPREMDLMMACGEIISTVVFAQTLRVLGFDTVALTGGQAGIETDYDFGNARILSIDPVYIVRMLETGKIVLVAGFQGVTQQGAVTTLGRGGSDTTASALGAALKAYTGEIGVEIYTDVDGVKTADPRLVPEARTLSCASYEEVAEMAHMGAKVVHPRAAEIANQYQIPLWVKSTFLEAPGTLIAHGETLPEEVRLRVTGVTHTGKIVYLRFDLPTGDEDDKAVIELEIYRMLQREKIALYLNSTSGGAFSFAVAREHLRRLRDLLDGLVVPVKLGGRRRPPFGRIYLLGLGQKQSGFEAQRRMLENAASFVEVHTVEAEVTENCTVVSVIAARFKGVPGVMALILDTLSKVGVPVFQTADSEFSISVLIPEGDAAKATRALHDKFGLGAAAA